MRLMIDIDSTLYEANALFREMSLEMGLPEWPVHDYWSTSSDPPWNYTVEMWADLFSRSHDADVILAQEPYPFAAQELRFWNDEAEIWYVSNRKPESEAATYQWLVDNGFPQAENLVVGFQDKALWLDEMLPEVVVDDRVKTIIYARFSIGAEVFTIRHPHNINLKGEVPGVHVCESWKQIGEGIFETMKELA